MVTTLHKFHAHVQGVAITCTHLPLLYVCSLSAGVLPDDPGSFQAGRTGLVGACSNNQESALKTRKYTMFK